MAALSAHSRPDDRAGGVVPLDAWYEILLHLPSKDLCRLRTVCWPWRTLLSDPHFITAHAALHPEPLIVAGYSTFGWHNKASHIICEIIDLSGCIVKRINTAEDGIKNEIVASLHEELICIPKTSGRSCRLLNVATGDRYACPEGLAEENSMYEMEFLNWTVFALGKVSSTDEYKVLRVLDRYCDDRQQPWQLHEVFTLGSAHARWRRVKSPPSSLIGRGVFHKSIVIDGIVYISLSPGFKSQGLFKPDCLVLFDLETEEWRPIVRGPLSSLMNEEEADDFSIDYIERDDLYLAALSGALVLVHRSRVLSSMDLWFLVDIEQSSWVKKYTIEMDIQHTRCASICYPLLVLDDGRIVLIYTGGKGLISIYNPSTNTFTDVVEMRSCVAVSLYTGSLLSLAAGTS